MTPATQPVQVAATLGHSLIGPGALTLAGGFVAIAWGHIRLSIARLWSVAIVTAHVEGEAARAVRSVAWAEWRRSPFGSHRYQTAGLYIRPLGRFAAVASETVGMDPVLCWRGRVPMLMGANVNPNSHPEHGYPDESKLTLRCLRGTMDMEAFIASALDRWNDRCNGTPSHSRFGIIRVAGSGGMKEDDAATKTISGRPTSGRMDHDVRYLRWRTEEIGPPLVQPGKTPFDNLGLCPAAEAFVAEVRRWSKSKEWYAEHGVPWTRGGMLYGPPGTGKTSLVGAIGLMLDWPVYVIDLPTMTNRDLFDKWDTIRANAPCIALFEDLDRVFDRDRPIVGDPHGKAGAFTPVGGVTMDALLNVLGGIEPAEGVLKIATTNHIEKLDPALGVAGEGGISTRPGRFDVAVELGPLSEANRFKVAGRICKSYPDEVGPLVAAGDGDTGARFVERCRAVALARFWGVDRRGIYTPGSDVRDGFRESDEGPSDAIGGGIYTPADPPPAKGYTALVNGVATTIVDRPLELGGEGVARA